MEKDWEQIEMDFKEEPQKDNTVSFSKFKEDKDREQLYKLAEHLTSHLVK